MTLLPIGVGFLEARKLWLYTGAGDKKKKEKERSKQEIDSIHLPISMIKNILSSKMISLAKSN